MSDNINSSAILNNLYKYILVYPPSLIIIYSIIIGINKCPIDLPPFLNELFATLTNNSTNTTNVQKLKKIRKDKLWETDCGVIKLMGFISLVCYLLIRYFMYAIKNIIKTNTLKCRIKTDLKEDIVSKKDITDDIKKIKEQKIKELNDFCENKGSSQNTKYDKCHGCITASKDGEYPCELYDNKTKNVTSYDKNSLENNCKYQDDTGEDEKLSDKKHNAFYIYNNFNIFLLIMFFLGTFFYKNDVNKLWREICAYVIPSLIIFIIMIILILTSFTDSNSGFIILFNIIIVSIMAILHLINMLTYNKFLRT